MSERRVIAESSRLVIREFHIKDADGLLDFLANPHVNCFVDEKLNSRDEAVAYMFKQENGTMHYAVALKDTDEIIGEVYAQYETDNTYGIAWQVNQRFKGKGYAYEMATAFLNHLFNRVGARRIYGYVEDDNVRSRRLCERLGMRLEGCMREFISFVNNADGTPLYENTCIYAILRQEWSEKRTIKMFFV